MATWPAKTNYTTGDILTAANMVTIGDELNELYASSSGGSQYAAGKNRVINASMQVAQYGTSTSLAIGGKGYACDRWKGYATAAASTLSRVATGDTTNLPNIQYATRFQRNSGQTGTGLLYLAQSFETLNSIPLAGKSVTFSFYARAGANYSVASSALGATLYSGTGTDQNWIDVAYTGQATVAGGNVTLTTTWQRFTYTGTVSASATELAIVFGAAPTGTAGANDYFEVTGIQLEVGSTASPYAPNGATYQAELTACQRYYWRSGGTEALGSGNVTTSTTFDYLVKFPVTMRTSATCATNSGTAYFYAGIGSGGFSSTSTNTFFVASNSSVISRFTGTGFTVGQSGYVQTNNAAAYLEASAEL